MRTIDPERRAAIETRFRARLSWFLPGAVLLVCMGPLHPSPMLKGLLLALAAAAFVGLNLSSLEVVRRARRERVARHLWAPMAVALVMRTVAFLSSVVFTW